MRTAALLVVTSLLGLACSGDTGEEAEGTPGAPPKTTATVESPPAPAGELVFESDFASPQAGFFGGEAEFRSDGPNGGYVSGAYTEQGTLALTANLPADGGFDVDAGANTVGVFAGDRELIDLADVVVQAYARPVEYQTGMGYGIRCREQGTDSDRFYEASIGLDDHSNEVLLLRFDGPDTVELGRSAIPSGITVTSGAWNLLRLDCVGDQITFSIDGQEIFSATDSAYTTGDVAVFSAAYVPLELGEAQPGAFANAEFDNMTIHEL
jgi:hypothetical protein